MSTGKNCEATTLQTLALLFSPIDTPVQVESGPRKCALYTITERNTRLIYVGISYSTKSRWKDHRKYAKRGKQSFLYKRMRELGWRSFEFRVCHWFDDRQQARNAELALIRWNIAQLNMGEL